MSHYKPQKKKKDPNAPKQPLSAYFIFSTEERLKVKEGNPNYSICDVAKELGKRWAEMDPALKQRSVYVLTTFDPVLVMRLSYAHE
jgi:high mobility group protein B1